MSQFDQFFKKAVVAPKRAKQPRVAERPKRPVRFGGWKVRAEVRAWNLERKGHRQPYLKRPKEADVWRHARMTPLADGWGRCAAMLRLMETQPAAWWARPDLYRALGWPYNSVKAILGKLTRRGWVVRRRVSGGLWGYRASATGREIVRMMG